MRIGSILENLNIEKRIAITPEIVKKYTYLGCEVCLIENYGSHLGIKDQQYKDFGVNILKDERSSSSNEDLEEQFEFLIGIRDKVTEIHKTIKQIRSTRDQLNNLNGKLNEDHEQIRNSIKNITINQI